jgi:flagellar hook-length control protein FliK
MATPQESGNIGSLSGDWGHKTQKTKPKFFAKLLEGLNAKLKGAQGKTELGEVSQAANPEKTGKNKLKTGQNKAPDQGGQADKTNPGAVFAFFRQNAEPGPVKAGQGESRPIRQVKEHLFAETSNKEAVPGDSVQLEPEKQGAKFPVFRPEKKAPESPELNRDLNKDLNKNRLIDRFNDRFSDRISGRFITPSAVEKEVKHFIDPRAAERVNRSDQSQAGGRGKKNRINVEFRDQRTGEIKDAISQGAVKDSASFKPVNTEIEISVDLKLAAIKGEGEAAGEALGKAAGKSGSDISESRAFEDALARELRGDLSTDIVRDATIIARNGGEGTIRLSLRPASLGDVKIRLEMTENKIMGHIILESDEALRAFERELPVLEKAFRDSGFSETNLEMSLASEFSAENSAGWWNFGGQDQASQGDFSAPSQTIAASRYEAEFATVSDSGFQSDTFSPGRKKVNLLV